MKADTFNLEQIFGLTTRYVVPLYQRPYVWEEDKQWQPLWDDVREVAERLLDESDHNDDIPHFMGAIVLAQTWSQIDKTARLVIDGQQRLTTLQLLMAAVRDVATGHSAVKISKRMESLLLIEDFIVEELDDRYKLVPTNADRAAFRSAINPGTDGGNGSTDLSDRTHAAHRFFVRAVSEWVVDEPDTSTPDERLDALAKALRGLIKMVVIDLEPRDNAQAIFETLNARGTPLLAADLIKNFIFQRADDERLPAEVLYQRHWHAFDLKHWRREVGQGRARRPRIDVFLSYWLAMATEVEVSLPELFDRFREHVRDSKVPVTELLTKIDENASVFDGFDEFEVGTPEQLFFYRLGVMETRTAFPAVLWIFGREGMQDEEDRRRALRHLESWLVRRMLCRLTTKAYNRVFIDLVQHLRSRTEATSADVYDFFADQSTDTQLWPDDERVLASARSVPYYTTLPRSRLRMVFEALEADMRGQLVGPFTEWGHLTIEHILPQEWRTNWPLPGQGDEFAETIERDSAKHRLGNLTLVTGPLNSALSNAPWLAGVEEPSKREALRDFNVLMLNKRLMDLDEWNEASIAARGEDLARRILRVWPGPVGASGANDGARI